MLLVDDGSVSIAHRIWPFPQKTIVWSFGNGVEFGRQRAAGRSWVGLHGQAQQEWTWFRTPQSDVLAAVFSQSGIPEVSPPQFQLVQDLVPLTLLGAGALMATGTILAAIVAIFHHQIDSATTFMLGHNRPFGQVSADDFGIAVTLVVFGAACAGIRLACRHLRRAS